VRGIGFST